MFIRQLLLAIGVLSCTAMPVLADDTPSQAYLNIHNKELEAKSYADLLPYRAKASIASDKPTTEPEKREMFELFKLMLVKDVAVLGEEIKGNRAVLKVEGAPLKDLKPGDTETTVGKIDMVLEDGKWKLDKEEWQSKSELH
jgi:hypothetical protein